MRCLYLSYPGLIVAATLLLQACRSQATQTEASQQQASPHFAASRVDAADYRQQLLKMVSLFDSGLDGHHGANTLSNNFDGYFNVNLDENWQSKSGEATTSVAQSRWVFMNAKALLADPSGTDAAGFKATLETGVGYLVNHFKDQTKGGFFNSVDSSGKPVDSDKSDFANCQSILALTAAYEAERTPWMLTAALAQVDFFRAHYMPASEHGGTVPALTSDLSQVPTNSYRNGECVTHLFESLMALHDVTSGDTKAGIDAKITELGQFIVSTVIQPNPNNSSEAFFSYYFDSNWHPSSVPFTADTMYLGAEWVSVGHNFEMGYLLSRAVERGFDPNWLKSAQALLDFAVAHGFDKAQGGVRFALDHTGQPYPNDSLAGSYDWWPQSEAARALLHFATVRGRSDYLDYFKAQDGFIKFAFVDPSTGGWFGHIIYTGNHAAPFHPATTDKGDKWREGYHESMLYSEILRLAAAYP